MQEQGLGLCSPRACSHRRALDLVRPQERLMGIGKLPIRAHTMTAALGRASNVQGGGYEFGRHFMPQKAEHERYLALVNLLQLAVVGKAWP